MCCMCQTKTGRVMLAVLLLLWIGIMAWSWWTDQRRDDAERLQDAQASAMSVALSDHRPALADAPPVGSRHDRR